ncbi:hypothetical protein ROHU_027714 [Labeo rohita]|uniref:Uncharacterized protein n=1 Tax=Labeo rohita TaxID=84645 RepID=A0A498LRD2_LABRO|nr:hypothetical protein ROHU_030476 [Labeo rohita]RXN16106.1 hypothetical protein ROHU_027714 [Labeo rohita]
MPSGSAETVPLAYPNRLGTGVTHKHHLSARWRGTTRSPAGVVLNFLDRPCKLRNWRQRRVEISRDAPGQISPSSEEGRKDT